MKSSKKMTARFLPLLAIFAMLPFALWSCSGSGDAPNAPTGPATQYNPGMDLSGATIVVSAKGNSSPGGEFDLIAAFTNGDGLPVQGIPLWASAESALYGSEVYFGFATNPTLTDENGKASIHVYVSPTCPQGSYRIIVQSFPGGDGGPTAIGYTGIMVSGEGTAIVTDVTLTTLTSTVVAGNNAVFSVGATMTASCTLNLSYQAVGPGGIAMSDITVSPGLFSIPTSAAGTLVVQATGWCSESPTLRVLSDPVTVTISAP